MNKNVPVEDLAPTILVGTFREANAKWIEEKKLYNLPLPKGYHYEQYNRFTHIVLWGRKGETLHIRSKLLVCMTGNGYARMDTLRPVLHTVTNMLFSLSDGKYTTRGFFLTQLRMCSYARRGTLGG